MNSLFYNYIVDISNYDKTIDCYENENNLPPICHKLNAGI